MKVIFFGTPDFSAEVLKFLIENGIKVVAVVSKPDKPKGRSSAPVQTPVKKVALEHNLPCFQPPVVSAIEFAPVLKEFNADIFVVVAYGEIIKQHLLDMPKWGCINLHASLLPKYRGAAPIQRAIINGENESGATIMHMVRKMDAGDIIEKISISISSETTYGELEQQICKAGKEALLKVLNDFSRGIIKREAQDESLVTFAPKIELENCQIHWSSNADEIHNLVRGTNPQPGAWTFVEIRGQKKRLKIHKTKVVEEKSGTPGSILNYDKNGFIVACGKGSLQITELQLEGKPAMPAEEFIRGIPKEVFCLIS